MVLSCADQDTHFWLVVGSDVDEAAPGDVAQFSGVETDHQMPAFWLRRCQRDFHFRCGVWLDVTAEKIKQRGRIENRTSACTLSLVFRVQSDKLGAFALSEFALLEVQNVLPTRFLDGQGKSWPFPSPSTPGESHPHGVC